MTTYESFDLDISNYNLKELYLLFDLEDPQINLTISLDDLNKAKKKCLHMHPDKSKLPPEYFIFYKKAFDIIKDIYNNQQKIHREITENDTVYDNLETNSIQDNQIKLQIKKMKKKEFHTTFNQLFEQSVKSTIKDTTNDWFTNENEQFNIKGNGTNINENIHIAKQKQAQGQITKFRGIQSFHAMSGTNMYDDLDKNEEEFNEYITCDPYSKLQYEDIRKVHRDETVFKISENDFDVNSIAKSHSELEQIRGEQSLIPMCKETAQDKFDTEDNFRKSRIAEKQYASSLKSLDNQEKNKSFLSYFLRLT